MNTPRTDSHSDKMDNEDFDVELALTYDLARQLERELVAMTALADQMAEALRESRDTHLDTIERCPTVVMEALAAYEKRMK